MRQLICAVGTVATMVVLLTGKAGAQDLVVKNVRIVLAAGDATDARVVGVISNPSMYSTYLVSATSDAAERLEFRDASKRDARVAEVEVGAYSSLSLEAKGVYLRLVNLKKPLRPGDRVNIVLSNEASVKTRVSAVVAPR